MPLIKALVGLALFWLIGALWIRSRYTTERWPIDIGWRRLDDLKDNEPERLWTVHRINRKKGEMVLIGLRKNCDWLAR